VVMEDTVSAADAQIYVPDANGGVTINPDITLPGFKVGKPEIHIIERAYPTNFGDLDEPEATDYSRLMLTIPVTRPIVAMSIKTFVPIGLIVVCAALVFFVRPRYVEGRIGLGIAALLTLVALQLTSSASLMMIDKVYPPRLPVYHSCFGTRGDDLVAPRRRFRATIASGSACCLVPISWQTLPLPGRRSEWREVRSPA